ncbi:hypothetical protein [Nonomuraea pusilla]|uniref:hypothetical protein n=1 Tax=Nonomuraea pusilla TaxID=46177 RepID=UPI003D9E9ED4
MSVAAGQSRDGPLDDPAMVAQPFAGLDSSMSDTRDGAVTAQEGAQVRAVVALVAMEFGGRGRRVTSTDVVYESIFA